MNFYRVRTRAIILNGEFSIFKDSCDFEESRERKISFPGYRSYYQLNSGRRHKNNILRHFDGVDEISGQHNTKNGKEKKSGFAWINRCVVASDYIKSSAVVHRISRPRGRNLKGTSREIGDALLRSRSFLHGILLRLAKFLKHQDLLENRVARGSKHHGEEIPVQTKNKILSVMGHMVKSAKGPVKRGTYL